jgi:integrase
MGKAKKGTVSIENRDDRLQLRYRYKGVRKYLSLGLPDNRSNRSYAQRIAAQIELDIVSGQYDPTQAKYRLFSDSAQPKSKSAQCKDLIELWDKYVDYKRPQVSPNTIANNYKPVGAWLNKSPYQSIDDAISIRDWLLKQTTPYTCRRTLTELNACCKWAIKSKLLDSNPFEGLGKSINVKPKQSEIEYFTEDERSRLITYFQKFDTQYASLVEFVFRVGCRPSEALALEWGDINSDFSEIVFSRSLTSNEYGSRVGVKDGLKRAKSRTVPCGKTLMAFLRSIAPEDREPKDLVFPSPTGKYINLANFGNRHWRPALKALNLKWRSFYKVRHTNITHALDTLDAKDVAVLVGNSANVIYRHYSGIKEGLTTPDF